MSWQATAWASSLPYDACKPLAFRVLVKLADVAHQDGKHAFRYVADLAAELGVTPRSIRRALTELHEADLIRLGDQRLVQHIRRDRRPTVWNLPLDGSAGQVELDADGVNDLTDCVTPHGVNDLTQDVTPASPRGDTVSPHGVTAVVTPSRTIIKRSISSTSVSTDRAREAAPQAPPCECGEPLYAAWAGNDFVWICDADPDGHTPDALEQRRAYLEQREREEAAKEALRAGSPTARRKDDQARRSA